MIQILGIARIGERNLGDGRSLLMNGLSMAKRRGGLKWRSALKLRSREGYP